jgi:hypothetical protein
VTPEIRRAASDPDDVALVSGNMLVYAVPL